ncbi:MAG: 8-amino-7-oxononanoate synthase [Chitinispirillia bacterium]|nr:8-amino-7-oxononanoate synthase [Chitinispirillia bacterium]MCL2267746.1 8-amino-7-oxononanoate synthase [Chitinispirillia bacterium]
MTIPLIELLHDDNRRRKSGSAFRKISPYNNEPVIDFSGNSYLNLQNRREVTDEAARLAGSQLCGNMASRLISQASPLYDDLENELAEWKQCESALVFNSGYAANTGIIQAICNRDTEIFCDRLNHASIISGCLLSGAKLLRYRHNDMAHLEELLRGSSSPQKLIVTDTVFSMDGDRAPLADICELGRRHNCAVMADEAHAAGIFGNRASGLVEECGVEDGVQIRMGTLSKAVAGLGGFFAGSREIRDYLINHAPSLIYSTGLPHSALAYNLVAVRCIRKNPHLGKSLLDKAAKLRGLLTGMGLDCMDSTTQIIPVLTGSAQGAIELSSYLKRNGIAAPAIRPPTVPKGKERVRFSLHLGIGDDDMEFASSILKGYESKL